jgi:dipeptidyl-peptidase-4
VDLETQQRVLLHAETSPYWVNVHDSFRPLSDGRFLWASERGGFRHLAVHAADGALLHEVTAGQDWQVDELEDVDEAAGFVYFTGTRDSVLEKHLYSCPLTGGEPVRLTPPGGTHAVHVDCKAGFFVDTSSSVHAPLSVCVRTLQGEEVRGLFQASAPTLQVPEFFRCQSDDVELYGSLLIPDADRFPAPRPCVVMCYGGPHVQYVSDSFLLTADLRAQYLRQQGYLVVKVDNRGSLRRGIEFEAAMKNKMGTVEVRDQVAAVDYVVSRGLADPARVAIMGWSYGGYLSAMSLAKASDTFRAAVVGAPVTSWDGYDSCYTERYMDTPAENPEGYENGSVLTHADKIRGDILLIHGLLDENVHFRHTARLVKALTQHKRPYELLLFPDERHSPRSQEERAYMEERIFAFLERALAP